MAIRKHLFRQIVTLFVALWILQGTATAEVITVVQVLSESPNIYRRPTLNGDQVRGRANRGEEYIVLRTYGQRNAEGLFYQISWNGERVWIAATTVKPVTRNDEDLQPDQRIQLGNRSPAPELRLESDLKTALEFYNATVREYAEKYSVRDLPTIGPLFPESDEDIGALHDRIGFVHFQPENGAVVVNLAVDAAPEANSPPHSLLILERADKLLFQMLAKRVFQQFPDADTARLEIHSSEKRVSRLSFDRRAWNQSHGRGDLHDFWAAVTSAEGASLFPK